MKLPLILLLLLSGCAIHEHKETVRILIPPDKPQFVLEYTSKIWGGSVLSFFKVRQVSKISPLSELFIGDMETRPDPNSVEAFGRGLIKGLK